MSITLDNLKRQRIWVNWSDRIKGYEGQKIPLEPNGKWVKADDPKTWHSYEECLAATKDSAEDFSGIGFELAPGVCGIDLDCKHFPGVQPFDVTSFPKHHQDIIEQQDSYTEFSPSGLGAHIITLRPFDADPFTIKNHDAGVEVYTTARYLTLTERRVPGTRENFTDYNPAIFTKYARTSAPSVPKTSTSTSTIVKSNKSKFSDPGQWGGRNDHFTGIAGLLREHLNFEPEEVSAVLTICNQKFYPANPLSEKEMQQTLLRSTAKWKEGTGKLASVVEYANPNAHLREIAEFLRGTLSLTDEELLSALELCAQKFWPAHRLPEADLLRIIAQPEPEIASPSITSDAILAGLEWGDNTTIKEVKFLVDQFLLLTEPNSFTGDSDTRKSTVALTIAAQGSIGARLWFNKTPNNNPPFTTLYAGTEDSWASVSLPRFLAAGGDRNRIANLPLEIEVTERDKKGNPVTFKTRFTLDKYLDALKKAIKEINASVRGPVRLLIFDPLISFFGDKDYNNAQDASIFMQRLKAFSEEMEVCILTLTHHNKVSGQSAKQRSTGSHRISDAHKMIWTFTLDESDKDVTLITPTKKNNLRTAVGHRITTEETEVALSYDSTGKYGKLKYLGISEKNTDDILQEKSSGSRTTNKRRSVSSAIVSLLKGKTEPMRATEAKLKLLEETKASESTVDRAIKKLTEGKLLISETPTGNPKDTTWILAHTAF